MIQTKKIIKDTFWELLEEKPYNKITVKDIVERLGVNRNTFYYYFQDIPTLMIDSIEDFANQVISEYGNSSSCEDCLVYMAKECMKRKKAFLHLFNSVEKDVFLSRMNKMGYDVIKIYVDKYSDLSDKDNLIRSYKWIFVGSLLDWLEEDGGYNLVTMYEEFCRIFKK